MNILVTINSNYVKPLKIMLNSLFFNNPNIEFDIYLIHASLTPMEIEELRRHIKHHGSYLHTIYAEDSLFRDAPVPFHYTKKMYFRLLAFKLLPNNLNRILYLDPDILVLNPIRELYETNIKGHLYAAAYHNKISIKEINKIRLYPYEINEYYNSGVLLMNLDQLRKEADESEIFGFVEENRAKLVMPDQDILNALYSKRIKDLDELYYNYDARYYAYYKLTSNGSFDMEQIINNTVILHFCGKKKPWNKKYAGVFLALYKHYEKQANKI